MSDFLSNLITRSFSDAPAIQPRVPSLFEPTAAEFFDQAGSSTFEPVSKFSSAETTAAATPGATISDVRAEPHLTKPDRPAQRRARAIAQTARSAKQRTERRRLEIETNKVIVPVDSFQAQQKDAGDKKSVSESLAESRPLQSSHRKHFSPVDQRPTTPIIRVTIGRVEVRAIHPPAAAPKQAKPTRPKLSLDDYLRKRTRGCR
jgi:hypothetical protein